MAPTGQVSTQAPQLMHLSGSMRARLFLTVTASLGQTLVHFMQPMQPTVHALWVSGALFGVGAEHDRAGRRPGGPR